MRNILLTIEYDGSGYHGWQFQPKVPTVQGEIENAIERAMDQKIKVNGTSRTDAGVHACGQCCSFMMDGSIPVEKIAYALNNALPGDIRILSAEEKPEEFHARFSCVAKTYVYKMKEEAGAFDSRFFYRIPKGLDFEKMQKAAAYIKGTHDFKCFQAAGGDEKETTVRTIFDIELKEKEEKNGGRAFDLIVTGDGFLYNMVRIITGTLVDVGMGKITPEELPEIIEGKDRTRAGHTAPPNGLYLAKIYHEKYAPEE